MSIPAHESRPGGGSEAAESVVATHSQATAPAPLAHLTRADAARRLTDCYAVIVAGKAVRKHLYFNLPAAQRAAERATARGAEAHLILVRLVPVDHRQRAELEAVIADA